MSQKVRPYQRIFLVDRAFQLKYTWAAVGMGVVSTTLTALVILYPLYTFGILRIPRFLPWPILGGMLVAVLINVLSIAFMGVMITHRIAGPVFGMIRQMRRVTMGRWIGEMKSRENDELQPLVRNLNEMVATLNGVAVRDHELAGQVRAVFDRLTASGVKDLDPIAASVKEWEADCLKRTGKEPQS